MLRLRFGVTRGRIGTAASGIVPLHVLDLPCVSARNAADAVMNRRCGFDRRPLEGTYRIPTIRGRVGRPKAPVSAGLPVLGFPPPLAPLGLPPGYIRLRPGNGKSLVSRRWQRVVTVLAISQPKRMSLHGGARSDYRARSSRFESSVSRCSISSSRVEASTRRPSRMAA